MNRFFALLAVVVLVGCGSASEEPETDQSEESVSGGKTEIDPATGKPVEDTPMARGAGCATCGPLPDPWKRPGQPPSGPQAARAQSSDGSPEDKE